MDKVLLVVGGVPVTLAWTMLGLLALLVLLGMVTAGRVARGARERAAEAALMAERQREIDDKMAELGRIQSEMTGRMQTIGEVFGNRQADLVRLLAERLDVLQRRVGEGLTQNVQQTTENLSKLNERLAVIDAAQKRLSDLTGEVLTLKDVLSNKQARGAFGQGRMEAIVRDGLPAGAYDFQFTLSNRARPDCVVRLPGDSRLLAIDAKFPLEGFSALRAARDDEARKSALARVRGDVTKHVKDIAERYLLPGETQDVALMFVPSEAIYSDLVETFDDVVQKAHRARVVIVSPTLMMMAISVAQAILRDSRMRDEAQAIQAEVGKLVNDVRMLTERAAKLEIHFRQAHEDLSGIGAASARIARRGERIEQMDFSREPEASPPIGLARGAE